MHARRWSAQVMVALSLAVTSGCYTINVTESFWFNPRPAALSDSARAAAAVASGYTYERITLRAADGTALNGLLATQPQARATVLFWGGDLFLVARNGIPTIQSLAGAAPVNVIVMDYRGYGESEGRPTLALLKSDGLDVYDALVARSTLPIIVHGHSLGSFIAAHTASARDIGGLVLQSSTTSPREWLTYFERHVQFKWWAKPAKPFLRFRLDPVLDAEDNRARVAAYRGPLLAIVGALDRVVDPAMSRALVDAAASPPALKRLAILPESDHNNVLDSPHFPALYRDYIENVVLNRR